MEPALGTARSLVDQFLPEAMAPIARQCGTVCDMEFLGAEMNRLHEGCIVVRCHEFLMGRLADGCLVVDRGSALLPAV